MAHMAAFMFISTRDSLALNPTNPDKHPVSMFLGGLLLHLILHSS